MKILFDDYGFREDQSNKSAKPKPEQLRLPLCLDTAMDVIRH